MNNSLLAILIIFFSFSVIYSQNEKQELYLSIGTNVLLYKDQFGGFTTPEIYNQTGIQFSLSYTYHINNIFKIGAELNIKQNRLLIHNYSRAFKVNNNVENIPKGTLVAQLMGSTNYSYYQSFLPIFIQTKLYKNAPWYVKMGFGISPNIYEANKGGEATTHFYSKPISATNPNPDYEKKDPALLVANYYGKGHIPVRDFTDLWWPGYFAGLGYEFNIKDFRSQIELRYHDRFHQKFTQRYFLLEDDVEENGSIELVIRVWNLL